MEAEKHRWRAGWGEMKLLQKPAGDGKPEKVPRIRVIEKAPNTACGQSDLGPQEAWTAWKRDKRE